MNMKMTLVGMASALAAAGMACGSSSPATTATPTVLITSPVTGASIMYDENNTDVDVSFTTTNITLKDPGTSGATANCGHVELFVDGNTCNDMSVPGAPG